MALVNPVMKLVQFTWFWQFGMQFFGFDRIFFRFWMIFSYGFAVSNSILIPKINIDIRNWSQDMWPHNAQSKNINVLD